LWGATVGAIINYVVMIIIIDNKREYLDGTTQDPTGLWTGASPQVYWGSGLIYGALGPARMFGKSSQYHFIYWGFLIGGIIPVIQWVLTKKFPKIKWSRLNVTIIAVGMSEFPAGLVLGLVCGLAVCLIWQGWLFRYHKNWWSKYTFILSAALDTGAAFTGLFLFLFFQGGLHPKLNVNMPSWLLNYYTPEGDNAPYKGVNRCGAYRDQWQSGMLEK
ncbi:OPT super, partial [Actinomortierella ambigua]